MFGVGNGGFVVGICMVYDVGVGIVDEYMI